MESLFTDESTQCSSIYHSENKLGMSVEFCSFVFPSNEWSLGFYWRQNRDNWEVGNPASWGTNPHQGKMTRSRSQILHMVILAKLA
ncbi:hypothetical protein ACOSQ2_016048 [Xanthoceras sorbifolium]